jgi:hypothetical protein
VAISNVDNITALKVWWAFLWRWILTSTLIGLAFWAPVIVLIELFAWMFNWHAVVRADLVRAIWNGLNMVFFVLGGVYGTKFLLNARFGNRVLVLAKAD